MKSLIDFFVLQLLKVMSFQKSNNPKNILFINTGQIGDLVISSALFENDKIFNNYDNVYFLINEEYIELFDDYRGKIRIIGINLHYYKYNYFYRAKFSLKLKTFNINTVYNLTSARPIWNDTLALGIGASDKYYLKNGWNSENKVFPKYINKCYNHELSFGLFNEYDRINKLVDYFSKKNKCLIGPKTTVFKLYPNKKEYDIIISPFSSSKIKNWDNHKFKDLVSILSKKWRVILVGSHKQKDGLAFLKNDNKNIIVMAGEAKLNELFGLISTASLYLGLDSGLSHIAIKTNIEKILLIGGGSYGMYFPIPNDKSSVYVSNKLSCFGCDWKCIYGNSLCLSDISVPKVLEHINRLLTIRKNMD